MKSIKIQKSKSIQKESKTKNIKNKKSNKQNNTTIENIFKNKIKNKCITKKYNIQTNPKKIDLNISNNTSLINAIESNNLKKVEDLLKTNTSNINKLNDSGLTPLHTSIIKGNIKIINLLIKNGAQINILSSKNKQTALHLAYINKNINSKNIIELLINNGADENILDIFNKKPSDYQTDIKTNLKNGNNTKKNENKNIVINNKNNVKKDKKNGYKGNIYTLKDSKDSSFVIITMDNISYLTSDENTIFQVSDINTKNNSIINNISHNNDIKNKTILSKNITNTNGDNDNDDILKDSLEEDNNIFETKKIKYNTNIFFEKSDELVDSLEISEGSSLPGNKNINRKEKTPNEYNSKYINNYYNNNTFNNYGIQNNPSKNLDDIFKSLNTNKRYSYFKLVKNNSSMKKEKTINRNTLSSHYENTDNSTNKMINNNSIENTNTNKKCSSIIQYSKKNNEINYSNNYRTNRNSFNSMISTISQTNKKRNYKKAQSFTKENEIKNNFTQINKDCSFLLNWLIKLNLSNYYKNFLDNEIYDINKLIQQMKSSINKFNYEDIESNLLIHKPGHIFRILTQLEIDAGIIDKKISNFMIYYNKDLMESSYMNNIGKKLVFSYGEKFDCNNCCNLDIEICGLKKRKNNDLKSFLTRYDLFCLYQNFVHNGFDLINYVILQMYGSYPINNDILENYFHIYDENQRNLLLKAIRKEIWKIDNFLNSEKYKCYENENNSMIKYDKVIFEKDNNLGNISEIKINNVKNECILF